jgi:hypothetical protein
MTGFRFENTRAFLRNFNDDTRGSMTVFGLFFFLFSGILGAIALDVTFLYSERTHLQTAADQAAHAALYNRAIKGLDYPEAKEAARNIVEATLPPAKYGVTIDDLNIEFGEYDFVTSTFTPDANGEGAVRATTAFTDLRSNSASAFLFRLIGFDTFEIETSAIFATLTDLDCLDGGFVAGGIIDMQNQNYFGAGFCIHSNQHVEIQPNNEFADGARVSMPGGRFGVVVPGSGSLSPVNEGDPGYEEYVAAVFELTDDIAGLSDALIDDELDLRVLDRITNMNYQYRYPNGTDYPVEFIDGDLVEYPEYIYQVNENGAVVRDNRTPITLVADEIDTDDLPAGFQSDSVMIVGCSSNGNNTGTLTIQSGTGIDDDRPPLSDVVIVTDCNVSFGQGSVVSNARIITTSLDDNSFKAPKGLQLGVLADDGCETGGAELVTFGGMRFAADFAGYGSQMIAGESIKFAATPGKPNDFKGIAMLAREEIDMASHVNALVGCGDGDDDDDVNATYLVMVR